MVHFNLIKLQKASFQWLIIHWIILCIGVILPLLMFSILAFQVSQAMQGFSWDIFILSKIHYTAQPLFDQIAKNLTQLGNFQGIIGLSIPIIVFLAYQKKWQQLAYLSIIILGNDILSTTTKILFHRMRPELWESLYSRPQNFSFPSGHAMGSMTLVMALLILTWGTRWSLWVGIFGGLFVLTIAWTRLYLGVHFPSDILGGWLVAISWTIGLSFFFNLRQSKEINT